MARACQLVDLSEFMETCTKNTPLLALGKVSAPAIPFAIFAPARFEKGGAALAGAWIMSVEPLQLVQSDPQFSGNLFRQDTEFNAMAPPKPLYGNVVRPAGDGFPGLNHAPEVIRTDWFEVPKKHVAQVKEDDIVIRAHRGCEADLLLFCGGFAVEAVQRLVDKAVFASPGFRLNEGVDDSFEVARKRDLVRQVLRSRMAAVAALLQSSQYGEHGILHHILACGGPQTESVETMLSKLSELPFDLIGLTLDELVTPLFNVFRFNHELCLTKFGIRPRPCWTVSRR